jgi:hypothetical protein
MLNRHLMAAIALALLTLSIGGAHAWDDAKYPNWKGQWTAVNPALGGQIIKFDPTKRSGPFQQAPLTPEYQKILEDSMADQARGGLGNYPSAWCILGGMPRTMAAIRQEYVVTPETTYILNDIDFIEIRRVFTDGRDWPSDIEPTYLGYSIGRWIDEDGDGRYDVLEVDTRGPRSRGLVLTTTPGCLCTSTTSRPSRSGFISTKATRTFFMTKLPSSITP